MAEPAVPPLEAETELDRVHRALLDARADLQRHGAALSRLQSELMASRLEVAGAREETVNYRIYLATSQAAVAATHAHVEELRAAAAEREAEIARLHAALSARVWRANPSAMLASVAARMAAKLRRRVARPQSGFTAPAPAAAVDLNESSVFKPSEAPAVAQGSVSLDELYRLSRSL